jgi:hypothetical protein
MAHSDSLQSTMNRIFNPIYSSAGPQPAANLSDALDVWAASHINKNTAIGLYDSASCTGVQVSTDWSDSAISTANQRFSAILQFNCVGNGNLTQVSILLIVTTDTTKFFLALSDATQPVLPPAFTGMAYLFNPNDPTDSRIYVQDYNPTPVGASVYSNSAMA